MSLATATAIAAVLVFAVALAKAGSTAARVGVLAAAIVGAIFAAAAYLVLGP